MPSNNFIITSVSTNGDSASLYFDKFVSLDNNLDKKGEKISRVCTVANSNKETAYALPADTSFELELNSNMIVNHAGGVLENAGLCLHKFFNYPMIPGSALKGITRYYARQSNLDNETIQRIFGNDDNDNDAFCGTVAFLPAIPADRSWELTSDILTPHNDETSNPIPIPFIAVKKGATFRFSLKKTSKGSDEDLRLVADLLKKSLIECGVGAKSASGYGHFKGEPSGTKVKLTLITPGFFAGADQYSKASCTLRVASLRGMLRYWWRTAFREFLPQDELKELEDLLWGSTARAGLIRLNICESNEETALFDYKQDNSIKKDFAAKYGIDTRPGNSGLHYLAYGMNETVRRQPAQRFYMEPGSNWMLNISVRKAGLANTVLSAEDIERHCHLSLSLLCRFGGIGSKSRNGFGSLYWESAWELQKCRDEARLLARQFSDTSPPNAPDFSFKNILCKTLTLSTNNYWLVLDKLGLLLNQFASKYKHQPVKAALGLPKQIHGPRPTPIPGRQTERTHRRPERLRTDLDRFPAPIWYHFSPNGTGFKLNIVAFPSDVASSREDSQRILSELLTMLENALPKALQNTTKKVVQTQEVKAKAADNRPKEGAVFHGTLVSGKKGKWRFKPDEETSFGIAIIINYEMVPAGAKAGDPVSVEIINPNERPFKAKFIDA